MARMCRVLAVSPSAYNAGRLQTPRARAQRDDQLLLAIRVAHRRRRRRHGAPRIQREIQAGGTAVSRKRIARLMRTDGLRGRRPRRFVRTTDSRPTEPIAPNTLAQQFAPALMGGPDQVWASDITYLRTRLGWLDLATRRVVGWLTGTTLGEELVLGALQQALAGRRPRPRWRHHSNRGSQYAGRAYRARVSARGGTLSMSRRGTCSSSSRCGTIGSDGTRRWAISARWPTRKPSSGTPRLLNQVSTKSGQNHWQHPRDWGYDGHT